MKAVVAAFNQEKALVGAFSVITNLRMDLFEALMSSLALTSAVSAVAAELAVGGAVHVAAVPAAAGHRARHQGHRSVLLNI